MRTSIDAAGRIVIPKTLRDAMRLAPGQQVDISFSDGRLEIEVAPTPVDIEDGRLPRAVPRSPVPSLGDDVVRDVLEGTRR